MELGHRAGIPPGVVNIVTASQNTVEVGQAITSAYDVKKVRWVARLALVLLDELTVSVSPDLLESGKLS